MAVIENDVIKVTVSSSSTRNVIRVSPGVSALSSVSLSLNELNDVDITGIEDGQTIVYEGGSFVAGDAGAVKTINDEEPDANGNVDVSINDLTDVKIIGAPTEGDALIFSSGFWTKGDAGASVLDDLTDVDVANPAPGAILKYNGNQWTAQALSIPSVPATYYHQRYATDAQTFLAGATETLELYYTARADGDGLHESAQSDTPTAGYDIQRKLYYSEKAKADPDTSADWTQFTAIADNTSYTDAKTALLAYLNERTGGTSPISLKITWEEVVQAPSFTGLLNEAYGSGAEAAYSTRRLNGNYSGDCMVIRRDSDGTTQSIGFVGEEIDESAIETFCTGTTCTVATWYDQSGNGNNATQTTPANQPTIYTGGQLVKEGGRLALDFDGSGDCFDVSAFGSALSLPNSTFTVGKADAGGTFYLYGGASGTENTVRARASTSTWEIGNPTFQNTGIAYDTNTHIFTGIHNTSATLFVDGNTSGALSGAGSQSWQDVNIGSRYGDFTWNGKQQEFIIYNSDKSTDRTDIEGNISDYFQSAKLLDEQFGEGAEAAYSTRQLRRDQTDCMVIRRASDSTTTTIGFDANGDIDETAIETFCTGTTCTVVTWKDQSGNGNDATAEAEANEPTIYTGGALVKQDGRVGIDFDGSANVLVNTTVSITDYDFSIVNVNVHPATNGVPSGLYLDTSSDTYYHHLAVGGSGTLNNRIQARVGSTTGQAFTDAIEGQRNLNYLNFISATSRDITVNGVESGSNNTNVAFTAPNSLSIGAMNDTSPANYFDGIAQEVILFGATKSGADQTSVEENIGDYFTQNTPLLDTYSGAAAAYSLRKLNSSYTGAAIEVYAGTNGTADIGFNVFGELDTVALAAHCGNQDGTVQTWYDQSGNGNHATQGVAGSQPKIYDGATTSVVTENEKPAVEFDGSDDNLAATSAVVTGAEFFCSNVLTMGTTGQPWGDQGTLGVRAYQASSTNLRVQYNTDNGSFQITGDNSGSGQRLKTTRLISGTQEIFDNGSSATTATNTFTSLASNNVLRFGMRYNSSTFFDGKLQEFIMYTSDQSSFRTGIEDNINTFYNIY